MGRFINFLAAPGLYDLPGHRVQAIMVNHPQYCSTDRRMERTQKMLEVAKPEFVFMDSGGFQMLQREIKGESSTGNSKLAKGRGRSLFSTPESIVEAAAELRPTAVMALDSPIRGGRDYREREMEFRKKFDVNVQGAFETSALIVKKCPDVGLFIPVQCDSMTHLEEFLKAITGIHLTGLSLPIRGMSLLQVAMFLLRFHQLGIKSVHLLGVAAFFPMALAAYFSRHFFEWVSLDAETWKVQANHNVYSSPYDLSKVEINERMLIPEYTFLDCTCPFCRNRTFSYLKHLPYTDRALLLRCHNYFVTEKTASELHQNATSISSLYNHVKKRTHKIDKVEELRMVLNMVEILKGQELGTLPSGQAFKGL